MQGVHGNFAMALDRVTERILVGTRDPPRLSALSLDGKIVASARLCGDVDDLLIGAEQSRVYASCGGGSWMYLMPEEPD